ncbi:MAG: phosphotransferase [Deltaproteobacteria bacterium]|nr:phosphotransferase [Deltaproteobacteria bacterium]
MSLAIPTPESITPAFFTELLRRAGHAGATVARFDATPVGTGQIGRCVRFAFELAGDAAGAPRTLVGKFPSLDPLSRQTGVQLRNYAREIFFYRELAARIPIGKPRCYYAEIAGEGPEFALILEDMAPAQQGDQLAGCTPEVARAALVELAKLHAPTWMDARLRGLDLIAEPNDERAAQGRDLYAAMLPAFLARFAPRLERDEQEIIAAVAKSQGPPHRYPATPWALVHIDYRLDNLLIDARTSPPRVSVVDWQSLVLGSPLSDAAYFLGASLLPEVRRPIERELVRSYHDALCAGGVRGYAWDACWQDYRRGAFAGFAVTVVASVIVQGTARGNDMFTAMARRHARHALDLGSAEFL